MGQYHKIYNKTKKEFIHPHNIDNGLKLIEQMCWSGSTSNLLMLLLSNSNGRGGGDLRGDACLEVSGRWAGDEIVIQGDYAESGDNGFINPKDLLDYTEISELLLEAQKELIDIYED